MLLEVSSNSWASNRVILYQLSLLTVLEESSRPNVPGTGTGSQSKIPLDPTTCPCNIVLNTIIWWNEPHFPQPMLNVLKPCSTTTWREQRKLPLKLLCKVLNLSWCCSLSFILALPVWTLTRIVASLVTSKAFHFAHVFLMFTFWARPTSWASACSSLWEQRYPCHLHVVDLCGMSWLSKLSWSLVPGPIWTCSLWKQLHAQILAKVERNHSQTLLLPFSCQQHPTHYVLVKSGPGMMWHFQSWCS